MILYVTDLRVTLKTNILCEVHDIICEFGMMLFKVTRRLVHMYFFSSHVNFSFTISINVINYPNYKYFFFAKI